MIILPFNQLRNLCYSYTHLRVFAKQKATSNLYSKYATPQCLPQTLNLKAASIAKLVN